LRFQAPQEGFIASLQASSFDGFLTQSITSIIKDSTNVAITFGGILGLKASCWVFMLVIMMPSASAASTRGLIGFITGVPHDGDTVGAGGYGLF
jgi:hypothetical protein